MSYRITQCYLPPDRGDIPAYIHSKADTDTAYDTAYCSYKNTSSALFIILIGTALSVAVITWWSDEMREAGQVEPI